MLHGSHLLLLFTDVETLATRMTRHQFLTHGVESVSGSPGSHITCLAVV